METLDSFLLKIALKNEKEIPGNGLIYGKMGYAIYYGMASQKDNSFCKIYKHFLDDVLNKTTIEEKLDVTTGLLGVCIGIDFILQKIEKGNVDDILEDIDKHIYTMICSTNHQYEYHNYEIYAQVLFYLALRLNHSMANKEKRVLFINEAISCINRISGIEIPIQFMEGPIYFTLNNPIIFFIEGLVRLYEMGIYRARIIHIFSEMATKFVFPKLHANRLAMLCVIKHACNVITEIPDFWREIHQVLYNSISVEKIFQKELLNRNIFFMDGVSGVYLLMHVYNKLAKQDLFYIDREYYYHRIMNSDITKKLKSEIPLEAYGLNGYWGINLFYKSMLK